MEAKTSPKAHLTFDLSASIRRRAGEAIAHFAMIRPDDRILIGFSGGKDSLVLSYALARLKQHSPVSFSLRACLIDTASPDAAPRDTHAQAAFLASLGIPFEIETYPIFDIIKENRASSACGLCAHLRRGILSSHARERGCNVLALGHHKDDVAETALMNLFYTGRFGSFEPHMLMERSDVRVIRPLVFVEERRIALEATRLRLPVIESDCPFAATSSRLRMKKLLGDLEGESAGIKSNILNALLGFK